MWQRHRTVDEMSTVVLPLRRLNGAVDSLNLHSDIVGEVLRVTPVLGQGVTDPYPGVFVGDQPAQFSVANARQI